MPHKSAKLQWTPLLPACSFPLSFFFLKLKNLNSFNWFTETNIKYLLGHTVMFCTPTHCMFKWGETCLHLQAFATPLQWEHPNFSSPLSLPSPFCTAAVAAACQNTLLILTVIDQGNILFFSFYRWENLSPGNLGNFSKAILQFKQQRLKKHILWSQIWSDPSVELLPWIWMHSETIHSYESYFHVLANI